MTSLQDKVRRHLKESWQSAERQETMNEYIEEGQAFLMRYCPSIDWDADLRAISLLKNYVLYADSGALDDFVANYKPELIALSNLGRAKRHEAEQSENLQ